MKSIFIAATLVGTVVAGIILYLKGNQGKSVHSSLLPSDKNVDGQLRHMKYSMG